MAVREGLLVLLADRPRHGYDLRTEFVARTGDLWLLNSGQVYTTLERLERDGLVTSIDDADDQSGRRRIYSLTPEGRSALEEWLSSVDADDEPRRDLVMKVLLAAHFEHSVAIATIDRLRHHLLDRLHEMRRRQRSDAVTLAGGLVADALVARVEADLRWLDRAEQRLDAHRASSPANPRTTRKSS